MHEKLGTANQKITIGASETKNLDFVFKIEAESLAVSTGWTASFPRVLIGLLLQTPEELANDF
jgi:hypothetical protein